MEHGCAIRGEIVFKRVSVAFPQIRNYVRLGFLPGSLTIDVIVRLLPVCYKHHGSNTQASFNL
jgi:hypothetical protein